MKSFKFQIVDLASKGHYQIACTRCFELTHNEVTPDQGINHPNHYFEESRKVLLGKKEEKSESKFKVFLLYYLTFIAVFKK